MRDSNVGSFDGLLDYVIRKFVRSNESDVCVQTKTQTRSIFFNISQWCYLIQHIISKDIGNGIDKRPAKIQANTLVPVVT